MTLRVRGYCSIFGNVDKCGEVVDAGAFTDWIKANPDTQLPIFWAHDHIYDPAATPIGATTLLREDPKGLYFEGEIVDTAKGQEIQKLVEAGATVASSFAYRIIDEYLRDETWHLSRLEISEVTVCTWGANPEAYVNPTPQENPDEG